MKNSATVTKPLCRPKLIRPVFRRIRPHHPEDAASFHRLTSTAMHTPASYTTTLNPSRPHFGLSILVSLLVFPAFVRSDEVPLESFEWDPMTPGLWQPGPLGNVGWPVTAGTAAVTITDLDAAHGAQSILFGRGYQGTQTRLSLNGHLPIADLMPAFVDFWLRPTSWSGTGYTQGPSIPLAQGTQVFVDGHVFSFFQRWVNGPLALYYHNYSSGSIWQSPALSEPSLNVWVPTWDQPTVDSDVSAREWVRFTVRIDPVTSTADVWLNGKLAVIDAPRSSVYAASPFAPSFYIQGSSNGPLGFDAFQCTPVNPLFGDMDADGLPDSWELAHGLNISLNDRETDLDGDGLTNLREYILHTLPESEDSDNDQIPDKWELDHGFDPLSNRDARQDVDYDGATNYEEYVDGTDPRDVSMTLRAATYVMAGDPLCPPEFADGTLACPYYTLQAAIDATAEGGRVVVLPGSYSLQGPSNAGASIYRSLTIKGNDVTLDGTGDLVDEYEIHYWGPAFRGIQIYGGDVVIENMIFANCTGYEGGAVYAGLPTTSVTLQHCYFTSCHAADDGGAVRFFQVPSVIMEDCSVWYCQAADKGGAFSAESSNVSIRRCRIQYNWAGGDAGGLHFKTCTGLMENCLLLTNMSGGGDGGAAAFKSGTTVAVSYCTVLSNVCSRYGAGFYNSSENAVPLSANILWGNYRISSNGTIGADTQATGVATIPWIANYNTAQLQTLPGGTGNNSSDPLFLPGAYTLKIYSPMIDQGAPAFPATDLDGNSRQYGGGITAPTSAADRGCFEFSDSDGDGLPDAWELCYLGSFAAGDPTNRDADTDGDGFTNYEEWLANSIPNSPTNRPAGQVIYVDPRPGYGSDSSSGSYNAPVQSISGAISLVAPYAATARICLKDGIYTGPLNRNLFTGNYYYPKKFYIKSINGKGRVTIDLENLGRFLTIESQLFDGSCGIEGLTIRRGVANAPGITNNPGKGGAILVSCTVSSSQPFIANCTIAGCSTYGTSSPSGEGGAVCVLSGSLFPLQLGTLRQRSLQWRSGERQRAGFLSCCLRASLHAVLQFCGAKRRRDFCRRSPPLERWQPLPQYGHNRRRGVPAKYRRSRAVGHFQRCRQLLLLCTQHERQFQDNHGFSPILRRLLQPLRKF